MKVHFIVANPPTLVGRAELHAALHTLNGLAEWPVEKVVLSKINRETIQRGDVLWWHWPSDKLPNPETDSESFEHIMDAVRGGAGLLLTLGAALLPSASGIEEIPPDVVESGRWRGETGHYANRGIMAFDKCPLLEKPNKLGLSVFTWTPYTGEPFWEIVYQKQQPLLTIARGCQFLSKVSDRACVWEYFVDRGRVLCIGSNLLFNARRNFGRHMTEALLENCIHYLGDNNIKLREELYWPEPSVGCEERGLEEFLSLPKLEIRHLPERRFERQGIPNLESNPGNNFYSCAARRILLTGAEGKEIREIWAYPTRLLNDLRWALKQNKDKPLTQEDLYKTTTVFPDAVHQLYENTSFGVREQIGTSIWKPSAFLQLEIVAEKEFSLELSFSSDLAMMWPLPPGAIGQIHYCFDRTNRAVKLMSGSKACWCVIGLSNEPKKVEFRDRSSTVSSLIDCVIIMPPMKPGIHYFSVTIVGGRNTTAFEPEIAAATYMDIDRSGDHYRKLLQYDLSVTTPDAELNEALLWAQLKLESFHAATPDVGRSLTAGYAFSGEGWMRERPGYGWYFGRDSLWTCFGLLSCGRWNAVADTLTFLAQHQAIDGKIIHEVSPSGYSHYDSADANPLFLIIAERYLAWTGDEKTIRDIMPALRKALGFSILNDRDGDGLTENTGVGHGWIEGGSLFGAHVTFYLAGIWLRALKSAMILFEILGEGEDLDKITRYIEKAQEMLNARFWNAEKETYYYGLMADGTMNSADTIMPAPVILFGNTNPELDLKFLRRSSGPDIITDWGARMISDQDVRYNPEGYHIGSVWPLYTGWLGLAQYTRGRSLQGYELLEAGAANYRHFSVGCFSEVLNGDVYKEGGVCPQQAWSAALILWLLTKGMLGLEPDNKGRFRISPEFPPHWQSASVENISWKDATLKLQYKRQGVDLTYILEGEFKGKRISFAPIIPRGAKILECRKNGKKVTPTSRSSFKSSQLIVELDKINNKLELNVRLSKFISPLPALVQPQPGKSSNGYRIIQWDQGVDHLWVELAGRSGSDAKLVIIDPGNIISESDKISEHEGERKTAEFRFPTSTKPYSSTTLRFIIKPDSD